MRDPFVKMVIDELNDEAYEKYVEYISPLLDFYTVDNEQINRADIYKKMVELCSLNKWSAYTRNPKSFSDQLLHYYYAYAKCDERIGLSSKTIPAYIFWKRGVDSLKCFLESDQSFEKIDYMEDAVKIFLCIMRDIAAHSKMKKYRCKEICFSINEKDIDTIKWLHKKKTEGKYIGFRVGIHGKIPIPKFKENITSTQKQVEKDYIFMVLTAIYCRVMESEGFY